MGHNVSHNLWLPQQLLDVSAIMYIKLLVAKLGSSSSWPSISLPFSLVVTEHMAPFQSRNSVPPVDVKAISHQSSSIYAQDDNGVGGCLTKHFVDRRHPGEDTQSVVLLLTQVSNIGGFIFRLRCDRGINMGRRGLRIEMHTGRELWYLPSEHDLAGSWWTWRNFPDWTGNVLQRRTRLCSPSCLQKTPLWKSNGSAWDSAEKS